MAEIKRAPILIGREPDPSIWGVFNDLIKRGVQSTVPSIAERGSQLERVLGSQEKAREEIKQGVGEPIAKGLMGLAEKTGKKALEILNPGQTYVEPFLKKQGGFLETTAPFVGLGIDILAPGPGEFGRVAKMAQEFKGFEDLTTRVLERLRGKSVTSKQEILDFTNMPELKQVERDLIRKTAEDFGDKVPVEEFANKVKTELLPLTKTDSVASKYIIDERGRRRSVWPSDTIGEGGVKA